MPRTTDEIAQMRLPGLLVLGEGGKTIPVRGNRIPHSEILRALYPHEGGQQGIVDIYRIEVIPSKTRNIQLLGRKCSARVMHTFLGFEVQAAYKRIQCPDLVTARYLRLFLELGCRRIRLPYDPTVTARIIDELESALSRTQSAIRSLFPGNRRLQGYVLRRIYSLIRSQLRADQSQ